MVHIISNKSLDVKVKNGYIIEKFSGKQQSRKGFCVTKFIEFCKRTDLHGYKYIVMDDLNFFERACWVVAVLMSTFFAVNFVMISYNWYARNPIVTVIESTQGAIWDVPFPAVTICDLNMISRKAAQAFADNLTLPANLTADEVFESVRLAPLLHSTYLLEANQKNTLQRLQTVLDVNSISIEHMFRVLSPALSCNQLVQRCMWKNTIYRCDLLFQPVFTYFNLCCTFNYYAIETTTDTKNNKLMLEKPRHVASCGYQTALTVLINTDPEDYYSVMVASVGALVFIDNSYNYPDLDSPVRLVNPSTEALISLSPERTYTTSGIKNFNPQERQCYYNDEVRIGSFRHYSFHNCMAYRRIEMIRLRCGCVPYFFPEKDKYRTCNFNDIECLENLLGPNEKITGTDNDPMLLECLPECEHYDYALEVAFGKLSKHMKLMGLPFFNGVSLENRSIVNVFFNDLVSTRYRRDVYLNWQNLLASFGGLLSLMLGFTLISGFDLILFFTLELVYGSFTAWNSDEQKKSSENPKGVKTRRINVQEYEKRQSIDRGISKKTKFFPDRDIGNWRFENDGNAQI